MKKLLSSIVLCGLLAAAFTARAQSPIYANNPNVLSAAKWELGVTNLAAPVFIDVRKQSNVRLFLVTRGATTPTNLLHFSWSGDGSTYSTNAPDIGIWSTYGNSALSTVTSTNLATGGAGYLVIFQVNTTQLSTNSLSYATKIP